MLSRHTGLGPKQLFAVVQLPQVLPRFVPLGQADEPQFILLEQAVAARLPELFGGFDVLHWTTFRITRDSDIELLEQESDDMLRLIEERLKTRQRGEAVRLEVAAGADEELVQQIVAEESLRDGGDNAADPYSEVYRIPGPLDLTGADGAGRRCPNRDLLARSAVFAAAAARAALRAAAKTCSPPSPGATCCCTIRSIRSIRWSISSTGAANDPKVLAIKQTLYRTSGDSPITRALMQAAENGKHVTALVELKARFDEERNVSWARQMERSGVHVVFGFLDLKTHCKVVAGRAPGRATSLRRYVHLGTGNYNPTTALLYTDLGLFTANEDIAEDASALFNLLTGYSQGHHWRKLVVAPEHLHRRTIELIEEQIERAQRGPAVANLRQAQRPGRLSRDRGAVSGQPGRRADRAGRARHLLPAARACRASRRTSASRASSIAFWSIAGMYVFSPDDEAQVFLSSADWMPRNFHRRVEVMFPVEAPDLKRRLLDEVIPILLGDNARPQAAVAQRQLCARSSQRWPANASLAARALATPRQPRRSPRRQRQRQRSQRRHARPLGRQQKDLTDNLVGELTPLPASARLRVPLLACPAVPVLRVERSLRPIDRRHRQLGQIRPPA